MTRQPDRPDDGRVFIDDFEDAELSFESGTSTEHAHLPGARKIYVLTNTVTHLKYVGLTVRSLKDRWAGHVAKANAQTGEVGTLQHAIRVSGPQSFTMEVLEVCSTHEELGAAERRWITSLNTISPHGYNRNFGGALGGKAAAKVSAGGREYASIYAAAEAQQINLPALFKRLEAGWSNEEALGLVTRPSPHEVVVNGEIFASRLAAARHYRVPDKALRARLALGWTLEQALGVALAPGLGPTERTKAGTITIRGQLFSSVNKASLYYKIPRSTFHRRLELGWTPEEAAELVVRKLEALGSGEAVLGGTPPPALKPRSVKQGRSLVVAGEEFASIKEAAAHFGVGTAKFLMRLRIGWSPEAAAELTARHLELKRHPTRRSYVLTSPGGTVATVADLPPFLAAQCLPGKAQGFRALAVSGYQERRCWGWRCRYFDPAADASVLTWDGSRLP
jgi:hypothetical protein